MLEKDFAFILGRNPQGYPQKLWIDVMRSKPHCHDACETQINLRCR
jgi:hypothetical protein